MTFYWHNLLFLLASIRLVYSNSLINVTIDDQAGDRVTGAQVEYKPVGGWVANTGCGECSSGRNATWHTSIFNSGQERDTTPRTASVGFYGSAVYVYCLSSFPHGSAAANMAFLINGTEVGRFAISSSGGDRTAPDTNGLLVYANSALPAGNHTLTIQNGAPTNGERSVVMLDYIVYTTDKETAPAQPATMITSSDSKSSKIRVLTGVLVTICLLFAILLAYLLYRLFRTKANRSRTGILPTSTGQNRRFSSWGWVKRNLGFNSGKTSVSFNPSVLLSRRSGLRSENGKNFTALQTPTHTPAILAEAGPEMQPKKSVTENRWALVMSWRDRAAREAGIPSLPPTSNAPTTVFSGPVSGGPVVRPLQLQRPLQPQDGPETPRTQPRRTFTVMNT